MNNNKKNFNVAIVGATGLIGSKFIDVIKKLNFPIGDLFLFASKNSTNKTVVFNNKKIYIKQLKLGCFKNVDFAFFSAGAKVSKVWAKQAEIEGAIVIDNSSAFRMKKNIPLIVPEINIDAVNLNRSKIISNPNCSTIQAVLPLFCLSQINKLKSVEYVSLQAVSGSGQKGICHLQGGKPFYDIDIRQSCIAKIGDFDSAFYTDEENKMINESKKILQLDNLEINATCIRVPVINCHSVAITAIFIDKVDLNEFKTNLKNFSGIKLLEDNEVCDYSYVSGNFNVFISRLRIDKFNSNKVSFLSTCDNTLKGASLNAIQIALFLCNKGVI